MTPIKAIEVEIRIGGKPPNDVTPGHSWLLVGARFVNGSGTESTWALVPDAVPASSPTDAEIARRVDLLIESCTETIVREPSIADFGAIQWGNFYIVMTRKDHREWACATEDVFKRELRRVAIRQLLSERGAK
jgi:hypothetical protein